MLLDLTLLGPSTFAKVADVTLFATAAVAAAAACLLPSSSPVKLALTFALPRNRRIA
jgi:hypothetical protein